VKEVEDLWIACHDLTHQHGLPERARAGLMEAAYGLRLRNARYRSIVESAEDEEISELTSTRDLKAMVEANLIDPIGERRPPRETEDPFAQASQQLQLEV